MHLPKKKFTYKWPHSVLTCVVQRLGQVYIGSQLSTTNHSTHYTIKTLVVSHYLPNVELLNTAFKHVLDPN